MSVVYVLTSPSAVSFPFLSNFGGFPYSLRHNNIEIKPINSPAIAFKCSCKRNSQLMQQISWWSYLKKFPQSPQPWGTITHPDQSVAINIEARPSISKKVTTHWRLKVFFSGEVFLIKVYTFFRHAITHSIDYIIMSI